MANAPFPEKLDIENSRKYIGMPHTTIVIMKGIRKAPENEDFSFKTIKI